MDQNTEKKHFRFPGGRARLWQMGICLALFIAALFFRAVTGKELVPTAGAASLREMAEHAGQVLARSELAEAFADGFRSVMADNSSATPAGPSASRSTTALTSATASSTLPLLTKPAYTE